MVRGQPDDPLPQCLGQAVHLRRHARAIGDRQHAIVPGARRAHPAIARRVDVDRIGVDRQWRARPVGIHRAHLGDRQHRPRRQPLPAPAARHRLARIPGDQPLADKLLAQGRRPAQQAALSPLLANPAVPGALKPLLGGIVTLSCTGNSSSALNGVPIEDEISEGQFTGTTVLSWKPAPSTLIYGSYARGYKAGGFNLDRSDLTPNVFATPTPASASNLRFDPETVQAFELGIKYSSAKFTANLAAFRSEFTNFQLNTFNGTNYIVQNIGSCSESLNGADRDNSSVTGVCTGDVGKGVVTQGFELEAGAYPAPDLTFNLGYTYAHTQYQDNLVGSDSGEALNAALFLLPGLLAMAEESIKPPSSKRISLLP